MCVCVCVLKSAISVVDNAARSSRDPRVVRQSRCSLLVSPRPVFYFVDWKLQTRVSDTAAA